MNSELLELLYRKYYKRIYLYLFSLSGDYYIAEDLTQETFVKALMLLPDDHANMCAWLYTVARNLYFNYRKKESRQTSLEEIENEPESEEENNPLFSLIKSDNEKILHKALQQINEKYREVLILQYLGGISQKEIGRLLKLSPENVRVLSYRGKVQLKARLEEMKYEL